MAVVEILRGNTEPLWVDYTSDYVVVTGSTTVVWSVRRTSDGYGLDFADMTFRASPVQPMSQMSDSGSLGHYVATFDTSAITNSVALGTPETYIVTITDTSTGYVLAQHEIRIRTIAAVAADATTAAAQSTLAASSAATAVTQTAAGAIGTAVWVTPGTRTLSAGAITSGSFASGAIDATAFAQGAADKVWTSATRTLTAATNLTALASQSSVDAIASAVAALPVPLDATATAAAVWGALVATYAGAGSFGALLGTNINATIGSRAAPNDAMTLASGAIAQAQFAANAIAAVAIATDAVTKIQAGLATSTNVTGAVTAIEQYGDGHWTTATGFATPTDVTTSTTTINAHTDSVASALQTHGDATWATADVSSITAGISAIQGAGFSAVNDSLHAIRNRGDTAWTTANVSSLATQANIAALPQAVWDYSLTGYGTFADIGKAGGAIYALKIMSFNAAVEVAGNPGTLTIKRDDGSTTYATMTLRDASSGAVTSATGEPAQRGAAT